MSDDISIYGLPNSPSGSRFQFYIGATGSTGRVVLKENGTNMAVYGDDIILSGKAGHAVRISLFLRLGRSGGLKRTRGGEVSSIVPTNAIFLA